MSGPADALRGSGGVEVRMPRLSESMAEGTIVSWLHEPGAEVRRGAELAEIETDKATVSFEADADGVLEVLAEAGATLAVGTPIARLLPPGTAPSAAVDDPTRSAAGATTTAPAEPPAPAAP
ncbi:lipoyl domain-containing protein, partial [Pseudonocardia lacus]|uniref:lipoyl domain-containing protein n=1 Tax=Pseudonocardia lacus TaxID=2835865 RepID=UPI001BDD3C71